MKKFNTILLSLFAVMTLSCEKKETQNENQKLPFTISDELMKTTTFAKTTNEVLKNELRFFGKISANKNNLIEVYPMVGGNVESVNVGLGDYVKKGQVLATIRSTEVAGFEQDLQDAKNELEIAKKNLRVSQEMFEGKLSTERDVFEAKNNVEKAYSQLKRMEQTYKIYNLKKGSIYQVIAPINGYIIEKNINQNMQLRSDRSDNIFDVADTKDVWAIANINEADINQVGLGMDATVSTLTNPNKKFHGKVDKIFKIIDPQTNAMHVRVILDNTASLLVPESKATINIYYNEKKSMLAIPSSAILFDDNKNFVLLYKNRSQIEIKEITVYREVGEQTYISSGLAEGDTVITKNQLLIYNAIND